MHFVTLRSINVHSHTHNWHKIIFHSKRPEGSWFLVKPSIHSFIFCRFCGQRSNHSSQSPYSKCMSKGSWLNYYLDSYVYMYTPTWTYKHKPADTCLNAQWSKQDAKINILTNMKTHVNIHTSKWRHKHQGSLSFSYLVWHSLCMCEV